MITLGMPIEVEPHEALLSVLYMASGHTAWLREEIGALKDIKSFDSRVLVALYGEERDRVAKVAKACLDAGVQERAVQVAEKYGAELAEMLRAVFADPELALTPAQQEQLPTVLRRHLSTAATGPRALVA
jgi:hypothetical protein